MKSIVLTAKEELRLIDTSIPTPGDNEVVVKVERAGICGSDIHFYHSEYDGVYFPLILGHEFSGTVYAIGDHVNYKVGEKVSAEPGRGCGQCEFCKAGNYNLCRNQDFIGGRSNFPGGFAEYIVVPENMLLTVPDTMNYDEACLIEPVAVAVHCCKRGKIHSGDTVLIIGAGAIGMLIGLVAKSFGCKDIIVSDVAEERLKIARTLNINNCINSNNTDVVDWCKTKFGVNGIDIVFDTASVGPTFTQAVNIVKSQGRVVNVGEATKPVMFERNLLGREIEITGSRQYVRRDFTDAIQILLNGYIDVQNIPIKHFRLDQFKEAFDTALYDHSVMKVMFTPQNC